MKTSTENYYPENYDQSYQKDYIGSDKELEDMEKEKDLEPVNHNL